MVRVLNFFCVALMGLSILALYHVSEKTRVAHMQMNQAVRQIAQEKAHIGVLETEWQHVASPERIQQLAEARLNMTDSASAQLSSFDQLPRRGADVPAPGNTSVHNASAQVPQTSITAAVPAAIPVSQTMSDPGM
jgi:cell division protein FtsL